MSPGALQRRAENPVETPKPLFFAWLVSLEGPEKGKDFRILNQKPSIGKQEDADIIIKRDFISRHHAVLLLGSVGDERAINDLEQIANTHSNRKIRRSAAKSVVLIQKRQ